MSVSSKWLRVALVSSLVFLAACAGGRAEQRQTAERVFAQASKTVVSVRLVVKIAFGGRDQEQKSEVTGTMIDPTGLTVLPAVAVDPSTMVRSMMRSRSSDFKLETSVTEAAILLPDGTEVDADVILKDADLDIAFVRPRDQSKPFDFVALNRGVKPLTVLDEVIAAGHYGRSLSRSPWVQETQVYSIIRGPRTYAMCGEISDALGTVGYNDQGQPVGVFVTHVSHDTEERSSMMSMMGGSSRSGVATILRPIEDVLEIADQAKKMKNPEPKAKSDDDAKSKEDAKRDAKKDEPKKDEPKKDDAVPSKDPK
ncbi:MAG: trypsin-like peptidase domain-containing protein [Deltaproteobacteria bacterium]|nr:trypsin-like peptidase domain-containing protein [Deltaproteobacteria bacterium]